LYNKDWEEGVIGIAAAKIAGDFYRPTVLLTKSQIDNTVKGSCRSIKGIDINEVLKSQQHLLNRFGGHSMAAGLGMPIENVNEFAGRATEYIINNYPAEMFIRQNEYELELSLDDIDFELARGLADFEPFGQGNKEPVFKTDVWETEFKQIGAHNHIKWDFKKNKCMIMFNSLGNAKALNSELNKSLFYTIGVDSYKNERAVSCQLKGFEFNFHKGARRICDNSLRETYIRLRALDGQKVQKSTLLSSFNPVELEILKEVGLLTINKSDIISIKNHKVDLNSSVIYGLIRHEGTS
jgi:single-stranded-DNA-specific exonuclease